MSETEPQPVDLLNCYGKPFGHMVVDTVGPDFNENAPLTKEAKQEIRALKVGVKAILASDDSLYSTAAACIIDTFSENDGYSAGKALNTKYYPGRNILAWIGKSSYREVAEFALWNVARYDELQRSFVRDQDEFDEDTLTKTDKLIDYNIFPKTARRHMEAVISRYGIFKAMDSFESGAIGGIGYCSDSHMSLSNLYAASTEMDVMFPNMAGTIFHERLHGLGKLDRGFFEGIYHKRRRRWPEEPVVSHAQVVSTNRKKPEPFTLSPFDRGADLPTGYFLEKCFNAEVSSQEGASIPADLWYEGLFSARYSSSRKDIESRLDSYFQSIDPKNNPNAFDEFTDEYERDFCQRRGHEVIDRMLSRIHESRGKIDEFEDLVPESGATYHIEEKDREGINRGEPIVFKLA